MEGGAEREEDARRVGRGEPRVDEREDGGALGGAQRAVGAGDVAGVAGRAREAQRVCGRLGVRGPRRGDGDDARHEARAGVGLVVLQAVHDTLSHR